MNFSQEFFTKKTCIYLPHNADALIAESCEVLESKYFVNKQIAVYRKFPVITVPADKNTDDKEAFNNENYFIRNRFAKPKKNWENLILKHKKDKYVTHNAGGNKAFMKNPKLVNREANQSKAREKERNLKNPRKSSASGSNKIADRNVKSGNGNVKNSYKNDAHSRRFSKEDKKDSDRNVSQKDIKSNFRPTKFDKKITNSNAEQYEDIGDLNSDDNKDRTKKGTISKGKNSRNMLQNERNQLDNQMKNKTTTNIEALKKGGSLGKKLPTNSKSTTSIKTLKRHGSLDEELLTSSQSKALKKDGSLDKKNTNLNVAHILDIDKNPVDNTWKSNSNGVLNRSGYYKNSSKNKSSTKILQMDKTAFEKEKKSKAVNQFADVDNSIRNSGNQV